MTDNRNSKIRLLGSPSPRNRSALDVFELISKFPHVKRIIGYPDLHLGAQACPVGGCVATKRYVIPEFSSDELNCGIALVGTNLKTEDIDRDFYEEFFRRLHTERFNPHNRISNETFDQVCRYGPRSILDRFEVDRSVLNQLERKGCFFSPEEAENLNLANIVPAVLRASKMGKEIAKAKLGGNHFVEFQTTAEILNAKRFTSFNLNKDSLFICYHFGAAFSWYLMRSYPLKKSMLALKWRKKLAFFLMKSEFHLLRSLNSYALLKNRWNLHFKDNRFQKFEVNTTEGQRMIQAINVATNISFALRIAFFGLLKKILCQMVGDACEVRLLSDAPHDSIAEEVVDGQSYWVSRKGVSRVSADKLTVTAGDCDVPSILGVGMDESDSSIPFASYDHGMSELIYRFGKDTPQHVQEHDVMRFRMPWKNLKWSDCAIDSVPLKSSSAVKTMQNFLEEQRLVAPVALLRPIANLRDVQ